MKKVAAIPRRDRKIVNPGQARLKKCNSTNKIMII
jgi:hypothetical protein